MLKIKLNACWMILSTCMIYRVETFAVSFCSVVLMESWRHAEQRFHRIKVGEYTSCAHFTVKLSNNGCQISN